MILPTDDEVQDLHPRGLGELECKIVDLAHLVATLTTGRLDKVTLSAAAYDALEYHYAMGLRLPGFGRLQIATGVGLVNIERGTK